MEGFYEINVSLYMIHNVAAKQKSIFPTANTAVIVYVGFRLETEMEGRYQRECKWTLHPTTVPEHFRDD